METRNKFTELLEHLPRKEHTILIGARQTGKSTLLKQLAESLQASGEPVVLLNLERKDILFDLDQHPENVFRYLPQNAKTRVHVLLDEVQYLSDPTHFLKLLYDEHAGRLKVVATGSSAFYIDRNFKDSLAGRKKVHELYTLDFEEFLRFRGQNDALTELRRLRDGEIQRSVWEERIWAALEEYVTYGGYPAVVLEPVTKNKVERLEELRDSFVKRDVLEAGVSDETKFFRLLSLLAAQTGNMVNVNELANTLRLTHTAVDQYLYVLQKCFHISFVRPFFQNLRKELVKMPKAYFNDLGLRNALVNYFAPLEQRTDKGALLENYVYRRLSDRFHPDQLKYWRTSDGHEVDFVVEETSFGGQAIEVKFNTSEANPNKYKKFTETYPAYPLHFYCWRSPNLLL